MEARSLLKIAVSGHRRLVKPNSFEISIKTAGARIKAAFPDHEYLVLSCLAEGADLLVTKTLLGALDANLTLILPLPEAEYLKDFQELQSINEYNHLRALASEVVIPDGDQTRPIAYQIANRYLINACDLMVVIWDGKPARGPGGTGEVVELVRRAGKPLLWILDDEKAGSNILTSERFTFPS